MNKNIENIAELCLSIGKKYNVSSDKVVNDMLREHKKLQQKYCSNDFFCYNALGVVSSFYNKFGGK